MKSNGAGCSIYPQTTVPYTARKAACMFGEDVNGQSLCETTSFQLDTGQMDSNNIFGINDVPENSIKIRKVLTCAPLQVASYFTKDNATNALESFNLGPVVDVPSTFTYQYSNHTKLDRIGYQVYGIPAGYLFWHPITPLQLFDGDVTVVFLSTNNIVYEASVGDPWFSAHRPVHNLSAPFYAADLDVSVMGCVDQVQICQPARRNIELDCTELSSAEVVGYESLHSLQLNDRQSATFQGFANYVPLTGTFWSVKELGDNALLARRNVFLDFLSTGLPSDQ